MTEDRVSNLHLHNNSKKRMIPFVTQKKRWVWMTEVNHEVCVWELFIASLKCIGSGEWHVGMSYGLFEIINSIWKKKTRTGKGKKNFGLGTGAEAREVKFQLAAGARQKGRRTLSLSPSPSRMNYSLPLIRFCSLSSLLSSSPSHFFLSLSYPSNLPKVLFWSFGRERERGKL